MADKPARALVFYGDGVLPAVTAHHSHLHQLASSGSCGFLALRSLPSSPLDPSERALIDLAQLLDVNDHYTDSARKSDLSGNNDGASFSTMAERFMGIKSTFLTNSKPAFALGKRAGFGSSKLEENLTDAAVMASDLLSLLGFRETNESPNELVFVHLDAPEATFVNDLVGHVQDLSQEGSLAFGRLFLVVVLGFGDVGSSPDERKAPSFEVKMDLPSELAALRPRQSYTLKTGKPVEGIREQYPLLAVYNQVAVTRRDEVQRFLFEDFQKSAGNLVMLADRFLYEAAFKLWKAPKYGA